MNLELTKSDMTIENGERVSKLYTSKELRQKLMTLVNDYDKKTGSTFINQAEIYEFFDCLWYQILNDKGFELKPYFSSRGIDRSQLRSFLSSFEFDIDRTFPESNDLIDSEQIKKFLDELRNDTIEYWTEKERCEFDDSIVGRVFYETKIDLLSREGIDELCFNIRHLLYKNRELYMQ